MHDYVLVKSTEHFNLWERVSNKGGEVEMYINYREPGKHFYAVWKQSFMVVPNFTNGIEEAVAILHKLEAFWPCTFLAKEYTNGGLK